MIVFFISELAPIEMDTINETRIILLLKKFQKTILKGHPKGSEKGRVIASIG